MTPTRLEWPPGPPPPVDGLQDAFRTADRRRARSALAAVVPVVAATALALSASLQVGGTDSLQLPPSQHGPVTTTDRQSPDLPGAELSETTGGAAPHPAPAARPAPEPAGGAANAPAAPAVQAQPQAPSTRAETLFFDARKSASTRVRVTERVHPHLAQAVFSRSGRYAGVWIVNARGVLVAAAVELYNDGDRRLRHYSTTPDDLPAGTYTVYVLGTGPTSVSIPLDKREEGLQATATRPATVAYASKARPMATTETEASLRLHLPTSSSMAGFAGGYVETPGSMTSTVAVCLPHRDAPCAAGDPQQEKSSQVTVDGGYGVSFDLTGSLLDDRRDVLLDGTVHGTGSTVFTCWSIAVALT
jgi:hypothetical protein